MHWSVLSGLQGWLETLSVGIGINLIFRPWNRNQLKKLESESISFKFDGVTGIQIFFYVSNLESN